MPPIDAVRSAVDEQLDEMEKRLTEIYKRAEKEIVEKANNYFSQYDSEQKKMAQKLTDGKITQEKYSQWLEERMMNNRYYKAVQDSITDEISHVNETAIAYLNGKVPDVYTTAYETSCGTIKNELSNMSFSLADRRTVKNLVLGDESLLPEASEKLKKKLNEKKDKLWNKKSMNAEVLQGIIQGESMDKIANRLSSVTDMNAAAAIRNARTMTNGAENQGRYDSYKEAESKGVILQKKWISSNQPGRTRDWHMPGAFQSITVDVSEPFINGMGKIMYPGDPSAAPGNVYNCRCTLGTIIKGFKSIKNVKSTIDRDDVKKK